MDVSHERWCRRVVDLDDRRDSVPSINGCVAVGQRRMNRHTKNVETIAQILLGGEGVHLAHGESIITDRELASAFHTMGWGVGFWVENTVVVDEHDEPITPQPGYKERVVLADRRVIYDADGTKGVKVPKAMRTGPHGHNYCKVAWDRPEGTYREWAGQGGTRWRYFTGGQLLRAKGRGRFLVVGGYRGYSDPARVIVANHPEAVPA